MKRVIAAVVLTLGLIHLQSTKEENGKRFMLPNPRLLRCTSSDCFQLRSEKPEANAVFPKQVIIDMNQNCIYGVTALYDKSVPVDDVKSAINARYGKWASADFVNSPLNLWRVESEKFSIQASVADQKDEKRHVAESGTKQGIYIAFGGRSACNIP